MNEKRPGTYLAEVGSRAFNTQLALYTNDKKYNRGLNMARTFEYCGKIFSSPAVQVYDRRAFFRESTENNSTNYSIMDISNLRQADMAKDVRNKSSADLLLNNIAHTVVNYINDFQTKHHDKKIIFCRYGGDEFALSYVNLSDQEISEINKEIFVNVHKIKGYFARQYNQNTVTSALASLKFTLIDKPQDLLGRMIFDHYIGENALLNAKEIDKIKKNFKNQEDFIEWENKQLLNEFYPKSIRGLNKKIKYLQEIDPLQKPEITNLSQLAFGDQKLQKKLVQELEEIFIDPLLRIAMLDKADIINNIKAGNISHVWTKDLKYMKELNKTSYAEADNAIKALWMDVAGSIAVEDMGKLIFSRNGGSFQIALKSGEKLSKNTIDNLSKMQNITFKSVFTNEQITLPIGSHDHEVNSLLIEKKYGLIKEDELNDDEKLDLKRLLDEENRELFDMTDVNFYNKLARHFLFPPRIDADEIVKLPWDNIFPHNATLVEGFNEDSFNHNFFISKRAIQRLIMLDKSLNDMNDFDLVVDMVSGFNRAKKGLMKKIRQAMEYSYSHDMNDDESLNELNLILSSSQSSSVDTSPTGNPNS